MEHVVSPNYTCSMDNNSVLRGGVKAETRALSCHPRYTICEFSVNQNKYSQVKPVGKDRVLDLNNKPDREKLQKLKKNLETLQQIARASGSESEAADPFKIYRELSDSCVNLFTLKEV